MYTTKIILLNFKYYDGKYIDLFSPQKKYSADELIVVFEKMLNYNFFHAPENSYITLASIAVRLNLIKKKYCL